MCASNSMYSFDYFFGYLQLLFKAAEWKSLPLMAAALAEGRQHLK